MSEEELDQHTTDPAADIKTDEPIPIQKWEMPKPVFRQTSGYLPQGFEKQYGAGTGPAATVGPAAESFGSAAVRAPEPPAAAAAPPESAIRPQPELPEELEFSEPVPAAAKPKQSPVRRIVLSVVGIVLILAFLLAFLAAVYFLFLAPGRDTGAF
ncbi:MAG: hypothetical protein ABI539_03700 [Acidobacteriota bacterium]